MKSLNNYLHGKLKEYSNNNLIDRKKALFVLGILNVPKRIRKKTLKEMMDLNLIKRVNRDLLEVVEKKQRHPTPPILSRSS
jgi:hypothetical protein